MTENIHKEIKFESNLGFGTVSAASRELFSLQRTQSFFIQN
jgi:hypothetical protein